MLSKAIVKDLDVIVNTRACLPTGTITLNADQFGLDRTKRGRIIQKCFILSSEKQNLSSEERLYKKKRNGMNKKLNILICESGGGYGGSVAYLYSFIKYLNRDRFNPIIVFLRKADGPYVQKLNSLNVQMIMIEQTFRADEPAIMTKGLRHYFDIIMKFSKINIFN